MKLEKIISMASLPVRLRFLAMVRSLRKTGCNLPVLVIPYDDQKFELPENCFWWENEEIISWVEQNKMHNGFKKYQCFTEENFQFADSDIIFLKNPERVLEHLTGFVTSCGHWHNPNETLSPHSKPLLKGRSTTWQKNVFNAGQFACGKALFSSVQQLKSTCLDPIHKPTCIDWNYNEQPGINLLINLAGVEIQNLTLPPYSMQSTWAGDYNEDDYKKFWNSEESMPYLIHWAGCNMNVNRKIDELFINFLNEDEKIEWRRDLEIKSKVPLTQLLKNKLRKIRRQFQ